MRLTENEQEILDGEQGEGKQKAMEILVALGNIYQAKQLFPVKSVQVAGVSYSNLGDAGLELIETWAEKGAKATVPSMLNPAGMDLEDYQKMGISQEFAEKQLRVIQAYKKIGIKPSCSCTPYLIGMKPEYGQHIAWSESSAVTYVNSVIGARTNREGGPSALAAAIIGKTPYYGFHLKENRTPQITVKVTTDLENSSDFGAFGCALGKKLEGKVPLIKNIIHMTPQDMKSLSASIVTYGGPPLFHIDGLTPEQKKGIFKEPQEKIIIDEEELKEAYDEIKDITDSIDLVFLGCPHCSLEELKKIADLLKDKKVEKETWIATARRTMKQAKRRGYIEPIEKSGAKITCDTCVAVAPLKGRFKSIATNSAKACYYSKGSNQLKTHIGSTEECIRIATGG